MKQWKRRLINLQRLFFYLTILFLPTQLGKHFWPEFSYVQGIRVDYLSPTLYTTDLLIIVLFLSWLFSILITLKSKFSIYNFQFTINILKFKFPNLNLISNFKFQIVFFFFTMVIGIFFSKSPMAGLYGLLKLLEFIFFGYFTSKFIHNKKHFFVVVVLLGVGVLFESSLAIIQFFKQGSLGGILYFLGERTFTGQTPGIANTSLNGELLLRPYGTLPHPNVLAGYLIIVMTMIIFNFQFSIFNQAPKLKKILFSISILVGSIALFLTMSRIAIIIWLFVLGIKIYGILKNKFRKNKFFIFHLSFFILLAASLFVFSPFHSRFTQLQLSDESIVVRKNLMEVSIIIVLNHPFVGVGLYNFLPSLPNFQKTNTNSFFTSIQPVHNIYLLIASETGLISFVFFTWFITKTYRRIMNNELGIKEKKKPIIHNSLFIVLTSILLLGLFDHYFLTLQQGQFLFAFVLGLCWSRV